MNVFCSSWCGSSQILELIIQVISHSQHGQADVWCISHSMIVHLSYLMCQSSHILVSDAANCIAGWLQSIKNMWCGCGEVGVSVERCLWLWGGGCECGEVGVGGGGEVGVGWGGVQTII